MQDLRDILDSKAKIARSIYGTRARAPKRDNDHRVGYTKSKSGWAEYNQSDAAGLRRDIAGIEAPHTPSASLMK